jgi:hypothetical protein
MHRKIAKAVAAAGLVLALCGGMAACGGASRLVCGGTVSCGAVSSSPAVPTGVSTSAGEQSEAAVSNVTVTGSADTSSAAPVAGVEVAFKLTADLNSCETCGLYTALTSAAGTYSLTLPTGLYEALCAKTGQTCQVLLSPPTATAQVNVIRNGSLNFLVTAPAVVPASAPPAAPSLAQTDGGDVVSGHMYYANGQPVANADITFREAGCESCEPQPHATTGPDGSYSISLDAGTYQAECDYIPGCGVQSNSTGQGQTVIVPPGGTVNFSACEPNMGLAYPQCLQS